MKICPNCKARMDDNSMFCPACGSQLLNQERPRAVRHSANIHCPQCSEAQALKSSIVTIGKITRLYWVCQNCKNKFRDPKDLEKEMKTLKNPKATLIVYVLGALLGFCMFGFGCARLAEYNSVDYFTQIANQGFKTGALLFMILGAVCAAGEIISGYLYFQKWRQLEQEKKDLVRKPHQP